LQPISIGFHRQFWRSNRHLGECIAGRSVQELPGIGLSIRIAPLRQAPEITMPSSRSTA
jgi:hypothetical protein